VKRGETMYQIGWFSTGRDKAAQYLLDTVINSIIIGEIKAEIAFVFSSREPGESLESDSFIRLVESYQLPLICFSYQKFKTRQAAATTEQSGTLPDWRLDYDREVMSRLQDFQPNLCVLAGYMLVVGKEMCRKYNMINLHPAAPGGPAGTWQDVIWQLIDGNATETGVMMHLATPELDKGPVATYCTFPIRGEPFDKYWQDMAKLPPDSPERHSEDNPLFKLIRQHGLSREFPLITATLKVFSQGKVRVTNDQKIVDADGNTISGYNLTEEINELLKGRKKG
jgi:phosphoribosylglycinamide formyltransferase-1